MGRIGRYVFLFLMVVCFVLGMVSCRSTKKLSQSSTASNGTFIPFEKYKEKYDFIADNAFTFDWFSAKFTIKTGDLSASGQIRMRKDSVIWVSVVKFIEIARIKLTPDSLFFHNKIQNEYYAGDYAFLKKNFGIEMDFALLESLLTGNDFPLYKKIPYVMYQTPSAAQEIIEFSCRDRVLFKGNSSVKVETQTLHIGFSDGRIRSGMFRLSQGIECRTHYSQHTETARGYFPKSQIFELKDFASQKAYGFELRFDLPILDTPQSFPFSIPNSAKLISL